MGGDIVNLVVTAVVTGFQTGFNPYAMAAAVVLTFVAQKLAPKPKAPDLGSFEMVQQEKVKIDIFKKYSLNDVINAHRDLEARKIIGPAIIVPN